MQSIRSYLGHYDYYIYDVHTYGYLRLVGKTYRYGLFQTTSSLYLDTPLDLQARQYQNFT